MLILPRREYIWENPRTYTIEAGTDLGVESKQKYFYCIETDPGSSSNLCYLHGKSESAIEEATAAHPAPTTAVGVPATIVPGRVLTRHVSIASSFNL